MPSDGDRLDRQPVSQNGRDAFRRYHWCDQIFEDKALIPVRTNYDKVEPRVTHNFMRQSMPNSQAIEQWQSFFNPDDPPLTSNTNHRPTGQYWTLYAVGSGAEGHEGVCHGGFVSTLLDQQMGSWVTSHSRFGTPHTAYMHVNFLEPLRTPSAVLCRAWITSVEGRKVKLSAILERKGGARIATAEALFVSNAPRL